MSCTRTSTTKSPATDSPKPEPWTDAKAAALAESANRAKLASRRRLVDQTTCEREYRAAELEFMAAMQEYKRQSGRNFPTWSEVLEVLVGLGYQKPAAATADCGRGEADT